MNTKAEMELRVVPGGGWRWSVQIAIPDPQGKYEGATINWDPATYSWKIIYAASTAELINQFLKEIGADLVIVDD